MAPRNLRDSAGDQVCIAQYTNKAHSNRFVGRDICKRAQKGLHGIYVPFLFLEGLERPFIRARHGLGPERAGFACALPMLKCMFETVRPVETCMQQ